jgi:4-diphosphocytidyl-2-C-methyl-D-erythritol kinase
VTTQASSDPTRRLAPVVRVAPAKLNLTLAVVGRRDDGYHALHSVMVPLELADRLSLAPLGPSSPSDTLHVDGFDCGPATENLVLRAVAAARDAVRRPGIDPVPLAIRIEKRIPVAAGLAGGSSDAAAALDGALEAWAAELESRRRYEVAIALGSDVPFFLAAGPALVEGRGERVTALHGIVARGSEPAASPGVLLVTPSVPAHTAAVFAAWSNGAMAEPGVARRTSEHFASEFGSGLTLRAVLERAAVLASANDLLPAASAVVPGLVDLRRGLARILHRPIGLSGSGPTLWALYPSLGEARSAAAIVDAAVDADELPTPGDERPFVAATTIRTKESQA